MKLNLNEQTNYSLTFFIERCFLDIFFHNKENRHGFFILYKVLKH